MAEKEEVNGQGETPDEGGKARSGMDPEILTLNRLMKTFAEMEQGQRLRALFMLASRFCPRLTVLVNDQLQNDKTDG
jgi:hypothetical protein